MNEFFKKVYPADIIGFTVIIGGFWLLANGIDTVVGGCVIAVVTFYFVKRSKHDYTKDSKFV